MMSGQFISYGIKLHVWGDYACFTRPEMKVERVSYDVMTPSAARGILEAIHWKPAVTWVIDRIHVLKPIRFENIRRNEVGAKVSYRNARTAHRTGSISSLGMDVTAERQQRAMLALRDVSYGIEAHFEMTSKAGPSDNPAKHRDMFLRRAAKGQCFHRPCLGMREFTADFELVDEFPPTSLPIEAQTCDLGWMLYDIDYANNRSSVFFNASIENGIIEVSNAVRKGLVT